MIWSLITFLVLGLIAGYVARLLVPGEDPLSIVLTLCLGVVGSFVGGFLGRVLFDIDSKDGVIQPANIIGSIIGAVIVLMIYNLMSGQKRSNA